MQPLRLSAGWKALIRAREREQEGLIAKTRAYAARVRCTFPQARVFLYGSVAQGDFNLHSDLDLLVVADLPKHPLRRSEVLYRYVQEREEPVDFSRVRQVERSGKARVSGGGARALEQPQRRQQSQPRTAQHRLGRPYPFFDPQHRRLRQHDHLTVRLHPVDVRGDGH